MRFLVVEDDFGSRRLLQTMVRDYGQCDVVVDGAESIDAFRMAWEENDPYEVIFMDIMMPRMDGQEALRRIREAEQEIGITGNSVAKIIMTTALEDPKNVIEAYYKGGATGYLVKPISRDALAAELQRLGYSPAE